VPRIQNAGLSHFIVWLILAWTESALCQVPLEESITVTAQAEPVPFSALARNVSVLTREQISRLPVHSVPELLGYLSSADVRSRGPVGVQADFSLRGAGFGQCLVLVDGVRLNDSQTGHHNSDFPVPFQEIERIEVLQGAGSSLYGADAFGGTINLITRKGGRGLHTRLAGGQYGLLDAGVSYGFQAGPIDQSLALATTRSSGFIPDRDFQVLSFSSRTDWGKRGGFFAGHTHKEFGALGFYGNSPSREWTSQTLLSLERGLMSGKSRDLEGGLSYRQHRDRFLWNSRQPGLFENRHQTHALQGNLRFHERFSEHARLALGLDAGGDWIGSSNLGRHDFARSGVLAEFQRDWAAKAALSLGFRADYYSRFGSSFSPSLSASWWARPRIKLRAAAGHVFRAPTFTELYYRDPNHQASSSLNPEKGWEGEMGMDGFLSKGYLLGLTLFQRRESNVIDWVRSSPSQKWRTMNIRRLETRGVELQLQRHLGNTGRIQGQYTWLDQNPGPVNFLSKYVLDYARHNFTAAAFLALPRNFSLGQKAGYKLRSDGRNYWLIDTRISRRIRNALFFVEGINLLNSQYQEIRGVDMPGRWLQAGVEWTVF